MIHLNPTKRHDFVILFDVENSNPNGDPDAGNLPRVDPETMHGLVTDVALKRKVRNYVQLAYGLPIFIQSETALNRLIFDAAKDVGVDTPQVVLDENDDTLHEWLLANPIEHFDLDERQVTYTGESFQKAAIKKGLPKLDKKNEILVTLYELVDRLVASVKGAKKLGPEERNKTRERMIEKYYDIRMFGAVLSTGLNAGQVRGPVQLTFAKSIDPIFRMDCAITRSAVTREQDKKTKENTMARKPIVPYALYQAHGFYNPMLAINGKGSPTVTADDLEKLWESLWKGFEHDHSAARHIKPRGVYVFTHANQRGNAPSHRLFDMLRMNLKNPDEPARKFEDYAISLPNGVLKIGDTSVKILHSSDIGGNGESPENTVVFTKIYDEENK